MDHELMVMITNVLVALFSAGGFWVLLEKIPSERRRKREEKQKQLWDKIDKIDADTCANSEAIAELSSALKGMITNMTELYDGQKSCGVRITNTEELSKAFARDRLNYLCNKYIEYGFIPKEDIIAFKLLGQAYISTNANTEIKTKFEHCINTLHVQDKEGKIYPNE